MRQCLKINVNKFAKDNEISLEKAHKYIQSHLYNLNYSWWSENENEKFKHTDTNYLYTDYLGGNWYIQYGNDDEFFKGDNSKELFFELCVKDVTNNTVELDGKRVTKQELQSMIDKLVEISKGFD